MKKRRDKSGFLSMLVVLAGTLLLSQTSLLGYTSAASPGGSGSGQEGRTAEASPQIAFQGFIRDASGPMNGSVNLTVRLWESEAGDSPPSLWSEVHEGVVVSNGIFQIALGSVTALRITYFDGRPLYLAITANGEDILPRTRLLASPYAIHSVQAGKAGVADSARVAAQAVHAATADVATTGGADSWSSSGNDVYRASGRVGIGTLPGLSSGLHIHGNSAALTLEGDNHCFLEFYPNGASGGRKAWLGFGAAGVHDISLTNERPDGQIRLDAPSTIVTTRLGVGSSNPVSNVHIRGNAGVLALEGSDHCYLEYYPDGIDAGRRGFIGYGSASVSGLTIANAVGSIEMRGNKVTVSGSDFELGTDDGRPRGGSVYQRAMVHSGNDQLIINYDHDFEGGTLVDSDLIIQGETTTKVLSITGGSDLAEPFEIVGEEVAGTVLVIDEECAGRLRQSRLSYDTRVAGVVSGAGGIRPGLTLSSSPAGSGQQVALSGRVYVLATAANGAIRPGDLLTTSDVPGYAMKATDPARSQGAVLGKAMGALQKDRGLVLMLVGLQ